MKREVHVGLYQFVFSLSKALDLINPVVADHHRRVAYVSLRVSEALNWVGRVKEDLVVAAALHDIGALPEQHTAGQDSFDLEARCARYGYQLLQKFQPFRVPARIVRFHILPWRHGENQVREGIDVPPGSFVVHLAKRVSRMIRPELPVSVQAAEIRAAVQALSGPVLAPEQVDAFLKVSANDAFWLDLQCSDLSPVIIRRMPFSSVELDLDGLLDFAELLAQVIDFRSRFTATHSSGVAISAATLAQLFGFPEVDCKRLLIAGYLHDIGKLAISTEVLEKNGKLDEAEWNAVRAHPYYTYRILAPIHGMEEIALWAGSHHERLGGSGYPFRATHPAIPLEARILAVADVFTALTEHRPYRQGLDQASVMGILERLVGERALDKKVVEVLRAHYEAIDHCRAAAQIHALEEYRDFMTHMATLDLSAARTAHLDWKRRLRAHLDGHEVVRMEQLVDHHSCDLGRWVASEGQRYYSRIPELDELEGPHEALHRTVRGLLEHHARGRSDEAERCLAEVERLSREIVRLLDAIEAAAARQTRESIELDARGLR